MSVQKVCKCISNKCDSKKHLNEFGLECVGALVSAKEYASHVKQDKAVKRHQMLAPFHTLQASKHKPDALPPQGTYTGNAGLAVPSAVDPIVENRSLSKIMLKEFAAMDAIRENLEERRASFPPNPLRTLVFTAPSVTTMDMRRRRSTETNANLGVRSPNCGMLQLRYSAPENAEFLLYESWIAECLLDMQDVSVEASPEMALIKSNLLSDLLAEWDRLDTIKQEDFDRQEYYKSTREVLKVHNRRVILTSELYSAITAHLCCRHETYHKHRRLHELNVLLSI